MHFVTKHIPTKNKYLVKQLVKLDHNRYPSQALSNEEAFTRIFCYLDLTPRLTISLHILT